LHHIPIFELHILYPHIFPYDPHIFPLDHIYIYIILYIYYIPIRSTYIPIWSPKISPFFCSKKASWHQDSQLERAFRWTSRYLRTTEPQRLEESPSEAFRKRHGLDGHFRYLN
jgi:hypothetical protein